MKYNLERSFESVAPSDLFFLSRFGIAGTWTALVMERSSWGLFHTASLSAANSNLPGPNLNLSNLITAFSNKGFIAKELVALSRSHTIGQARCTVFKSHIYNDANINAEENARTEGVA
ncbi:hypothetical protein CsSME_00004982 [Camellia sinensis var. sinensis]